MAFTDTATSDYIDNTTTGAELLPPDPSRILDSDVYIPWLAYFIMFQMVGAIVRRTCWNNVHHNFGSLTPAALAYKQYRLRNLTVCLIHSAISGVWSLSFLVARPDIMFDDFHTLHWHQYWAVQLPIMSCGYFIYDTMDMMCNEYSRWTLELLLHHLASIVVFNASILPRKFLPYAYWALLMEVNSTFLHIRSLMQLSGDKDRRPKLFGLVKTINIITFVIFRFAVQYYQIRWGFYQSTNLHVYYWSIAVIGGLFFLLINAILFLRVLAGDGMLGSFGQRHTAIGRDSGVVATQQHPAKVKGGSSSKEEYLLDGERHVKNGYVLNDRNKIINGYYSKGETWTTNNSQHKEALMSNGKKVD